MANHFQLIDEHGNFRGDCLREFVQSTELNGVRDNYFVISIIGPQSSGKSTLMNATFGTAFEVVENNNLRTTRGLWMDRGDINRTMTILMDLEGSDGRDRRDDTNFERQSALFASLFSNLILINLQYTDLARENGANRPLLRIVFEEMLRSFEESNWTKTLFLTIRDSNLNDDLMELEDTLRRDLRQIWDDDIIRPEYYRDRQFNSFFRVKVIFFPHYRFQKREFYDKVNDMKEIIGTFSGGGHSLRVPGLAFSDALNRLWEEIQQNRRLDIPSIRVQIAEKSCGEIVKRIFASLKIHKELLSHATTARENLQPGFGKRLKEIRDSYLAEYDHDAVLLDKTIRTTHRTKLEMKIQEVLLNLN